MSKMKKIIILVFVCVIGGYFGYKYIMTGGERNLETEIPNWDFEKIKQQAQQKWNAELSKIEVESTDVNKLNIFYTALYHTQIVPNINMDVDGQYRGMDNTIHKAEGFTYYSVFSLWDTYRATHPLYNIIDRQRSLDYIKTLKKIEQTEEEDNAILITF